MSAVRRIAPDSRRRALMSKVHIARKELALDEPTYRAALQRITGKASSADLSDAQLVSVLEDFKAKGWKPAVAAGRADNPVANKARSLWISLHQLGTVRNPSEKALEAFGCRQLGVAKLQWADQSQGYRMVEALKAMAIRAGWDAGLQDVHALKLALVMRQWARLQEIGAIGTQHTKSSGLSMWANRHNLVPCFKDVAQFTDAELEAVAARLGRWINGHGGAAGTPG